MWWRLIWRHNHLVGLRTHCQSGPHHERCQTNRAVAVVILMHATVRSVHFCGSQIWWTGQNVHLKWCNALFFRTGTHYVYSRDTIGISKWPGSNARHLHWFCPGTLYNSSNTDIYETLLLTGTISAECVQKIKEKDINYYSAIIRSTRDELKAKGLEASAQLEEFGGLLK